MENGGCRCSQVMKLLDDRETTWITQFLMGLNDDFSNIRGQILNMKPRPSLFDMYNMLESDESQRQRTVITPNPSAFQVKTQISGFQQQSFQKSRTSCTHCGLSGHTVDKCYKIIGYHVGWLPKNQRKNPNQRFIPSASANLAITDFPSDIDKGVALSNDHIQHLVSYLSSKLQPQLSTGSPNATITEIPAEASSSSMKPTICQITGIFFPSIFCSMSSKNGSYYYSTADNISTMDTLVVDTGATHHVTYDKNLFQTMMPIHDTTVKLPTGVGVKIEGLGIVNQCILNFALCLIHSSV